MNPAVREKVAAGVIEARPAGSDGPWVQCQLTSQALNPWAAANAVTITAGAGGTIILHFVGGTLLEARGVCGRG